MEGALDAKTHLRHQPRIDKAVRLRVAAAVTAVDDLAAHADGDGTLRQQAGRGDRAAQVEAEARVDHASAEAETGSQTATRNDVCLAAKPTSWPPRPRPAQPPGWRTLTT